MKRVVLFLATNIAILLVLSIALRVFGFQGFLAENGVDLALPQLLLFATIFGFGGSFISLAMSKWVAKRATGAQVITEARTPVEAWLLETVRQQAQAAGIGMPEVAIFPSPTPGGTHRWWRSAQACSSAWTAPRWRPSSGTRSATSPTGTW